MRTGIFFAMAVAAGACFHDAPTSTTSPTDAKQGAASSCASAVATMISSAKPTDPETAGNLRAVLTNRCIEDHWTAGVQACFGSAGTEEHLRACWEELTDEQRDKAERVASAVERAGTHRRHTRDEAAAPDVAPPDADSKTGFDLYVSPASVTSWSLDGEVRTDRLPVRIRGIAPGQHVVAIDAPPGFQGERRTIDVQAGAASEMRIELTPLDKHAAPTTKLRVTGIEPHKGDVDGGTYVRISGNAFTCGGSCARSAKVYFGSREATVIRFASDSELIVEAPGGKVGETVDVLVIFEPGGEMKLAKAFAFVAKP